MLLFSCSIEEPTTPDPIDNIVIDGNSLAVGGYNHMFSDSGYPVTNVAISGQTLSMMAYYCADVDSAISDNTLLIVDEVTNELLYGASADTAVERLRRYCQDRMRLHPTLRIVVVTPTPRSNPNNPPDFESRRQSAIYLMKRDRTICDFLANAGEDSSIGEYGSQFDTRFYYDSVHHTTLGYNIRGTLIWKACH